MAVQKNPPPPLPLHFILILWTEGAVQKNRG